MIWTGTRIELNGFIDHIDNQIDSIKFTHEISQEQISFLDTLVKIEHNQLVTDLYAKPTDSQDYLLYNSAHPQRCKYSVPYSQFLRIRRICSRIDDFEKKILTMALNFNRRNYPKDLLIEAATLARDKFRDDLLEDKPKPD